MRNHPNDRDSAGREILQKQAAALTPTERATIEETIREVAAQH